MLSSANSPELFRIDGNESPMSSPGRPFDLESVKVLTISIFCFGKMGYSHFSDWACEAVRIKVRNNSFLITVT